MAFRIRRGLLANLGSMDPPPVEGELFYTTDTKGLYVGDDEGAANLVSSAVVTVNGYQGAVDLVTDDIPEELGATNKWFTDERAQDAVWAALEAGNSFNTGITFSYNDGSGRLSASVAFPGSGTVNTGTTNSLAYYTGNTSEVDDAVGLQWNNTSKILTISEGTVTLNTNSSAKDMLILNSYTDTVQGLSRYRRARGTQGSLAALQDYDAIHTLLFDAYDGTTFNVAGGISVNVGSGSSTGISPGLMSFTLTDSSGVPINIVRIAQSGRLTVGPYGAADTTVSGSIDIVQTRNSPSEFPLLNLTNVFSNANGVRVGMSKNRGTFATPTAALSGDTIGTLEYFAFDGTSAPQAAEIRVTVDSTVSTGVVPGAITFKTANSLGVLTNTAKMSKKGLEVLTGAVKLPVYATTTARDTALASPEAGMLVFIETGAKIQINTNNTTGGWVDLN
jgi:hypothetical protein